MPFLQSNGFGTIQAVRVYKTYGEKALELAQENPYRLSSDNQGIAPNMADQLAQRLGIDSH